MRPNGAQGEAIQQLPSGVNDENQIRPGSRFDVTNASLKSLLSWAQMNVGSQPRDELSWRIGHCYTDNCTE